MRTRAIAGKAGKAAGSKAWGSRSLKDNSAFQLAKQLAPAMRAADPASARSAAGPVKTLDDMTPAEKAELSRQLKAPIKE